MLQVLVCSKKVHLSVCACRHFPLAVFDLIACISPRMSFVCSCAQKCVWLVLITLIFLGNSGGCCYFRGAQHHTISGRPGLLASLSQAIRAFLFKVFRFSLITADNWLVGFIFNMSDSVFATQVALSHRQEPEHLASFNESKSRQLVSPSTCLF